MTLPDFFETDRALIDQALERILPPEHAQPSSIHRAMRYSVFAGGKRLRPVLCVESTHMFAGDISAGVEVGCAIEFIHTYSLIHDDLPALDNDDLRRGKPTCHKMFGEALAILAGDGLLTLAFATLGTAPLDPSSRVRIIAEIGAAAGTVNGMVGGQVADLEAERKPVDAAGLEYIHRSKTAALICGSVVAGAIAGGACDEDIERLRGFGENIGWAFQVIDDILDVEESSAALGKTAGKDKEQQKATYPALYGLDKSHGIAAELAAEALSNLVPFGERADHLRAIGQHLVARRS